MNSLMSRIVSKIAPIYPQAKRWLHSFNGGIFPKYYKELSANQPVREGFIPQKLIIPLQQQVGLPAEVIVQVGDQVLKNQLIARSSKDASKSLVVPIHAPTSGTVIAVEKHTLPHPSGLQDIAIVLEPDFKNEAINNALKVSGKHPATPTELKDIILEAGIVGMGGAGFPTYAKIPAAKNKIHTLMINGAECEPFITCDDLLMQTDADAIVQGAIITAKALGANKILCGIETNKPSAIKAMTKAAETHSKSSQSNNQIKIEVIAVESVYPMGGQKQLTQELTGKEIPEKMHAVDLGMLMMNVATFAAIYRAVEFGQPLTERMVSVTGLGFEKPFNIKALIGTPFIELAQLAQPKSQLNYPLVMGGPMMGFAVKDNEVPVLKTTNCILANPPEPAEVQMPCIRCGECMDACPINLLPQQLYWYSQAHEFDKVEELNVFDCIECGCCSYVCPSHIPLVQYYRNAKSEIKEIKAEEQAVELAKKRHEFKLARIEREKQEREARLKAKKEAVKKQALEEKQSKQQAEPNATTADSAKTSPGKSAAAAAAARAAAARKAKQAAGNTSAEDNLPPARRKAIEAAKKAAAAKANASTAKPETAKSQNATEQKTDLKTNTKADPRAAARKAAAMAAAKRKAKQNQDTGSVQSAETTAKPAVEDIKENQPDAREAAKKAAMAAAKKRAAAKKQAETTNSSAEIASFNDDPMANLPKEQRVEVQKDPKKAAQEAAKRAAMAAVKRRKEVVDDSLTAKPEDVQINDLTEVTEETAASKKEKARKAAMQAARMAAKKRAQNASSSQIQDTVPAAEQSVESRSKDGIQSTAESSTETSAEDKKQQAMRLAKQAAAKRAAQKRAERSVDELEGTSANNSANKSSTSDNTPTNGDTSA